MTRQLTGTDLANLGLLGLARYDSHEMADELRERGFQVLGVGGYTESFSIRPTPPLSQPPMRRLTIRERAPGPGILSQPPMRRLTAILLTQQRRRVSQPPMRRLTVGSISPELSMISQPPMRRLTPPFIMQ